MVDGELEGQDVGAAWSPAHRGLEGCREGLPTISRKFSGAGMFSFRALPSRVNKTRLDSGGLVVPKGPSSSTGYRRCSLPLVQDTAFHRWVSSRRRGCCRGSTWWVSPA